MHDAERLIFWLCRGAVTLLTISNLVIISEKNTTKEKKKTRFTKDDKKKEIFANIDFCLRLSFELLNETIYISIFSL